MAIQVQPFSVSPTRRGLSLKRLGSWSEECGPGFPDRREGFYDGFSVYHGENQSNGAPGLEQVAAVQRQIPHIAECAEPNCTEFFLPPGRARNGNSICALWDPEDRKTTRAQGPLVDRSFWPVRFSAAVTKNLNLKKFVPLALFFITLGHRYTRPAMGGGGPEPPATRRQILFHFPASQANWRRWARNLERGDCLVPVRLAPDAQVIVDAIIRGANISLSASFERGLFPSCWAGRLIEPSSAGRGRERSPCLGFKIGPLHCGAVPANAIVPNPRVAGANSLGKYHCVTTTPR